jgi:gluconate:H+ symporter, GntP family
MLAITVASSGTLWWLLLAIGVLVALILWAKWHAFPALVAASIGYGLLAGLAPLAAVQKFTEGFGGTLGFVAGIIAFGTMLGGLLGASGGAGVIARWLSGGLRAGALEWAVAAAAFLIGLPVFFAVGIVLLTPIVAALASERQVPFVRVGLPMVAALAVSHSFVPPHPGVLAAIDVLGADTGLTIVFALIAAIPALALAGPLWFRLFRPAFSAAAPLVAVPSEPPVRLPALPVALLTILLPVVLMLGGSVAGLILPLASPTRRIAEFLGAPLVAMFLALLMATWSFGFALGRGRREVWKVAEQPLGACVGAILVVGAGGGFAKVIEFSGAGRTMAEMLSSFGLSPLVLGWMVAAAVRIAVGSTTVAIQISAGLLAGQTGAARPELLAVAIAAGGLFFSHVNDGGFWLVKEYLGMTAPQTFKTWTVMTCLASVIGLGIVLLLATVIS